jgi:hypothetical protein
LEKKNSQTYSDLTQPHQASSGRQESFLCTRWMHVRDLKVRSVLEWCDWLASWCDWLASWRDWLASCPNQTKPLPVKQLPKFLLHSNLEVFLCTNSGATLLIWGMIRD